MAIDGMDEVWCIPTDDLVATGQKRRHEDYFDGRSIRVSIDGDLLE